MDEVPITVGRAIMIYWSLLWRSFVLFFPPAMAYAAISRIPTIEGHHAVFLVGIVMTHVIAIWWFLKRNAWKSFRVALVTRD